MTLRRLVLPLVLAASLVAATSSQAAPAPQVTDPAGDAVGLQGMHDITSITYEVTGTVKKVGRKSVKTPKALVVTLGLAGAPSVAPGTYYAVGAVTDCGALTMSASLTALSAPSYGGSGTFFECGPEQEVAGVVVTPFGVSPTITLGATSVVFTVPWKSLPKEIALGDSWFDLQGYTTLSDPVIGFDSQTFTSIFGVDTVLDLAKGEQAKLS
jgi:hypothetical protein